MHEDTNRTVLSNNKAKQQWTEREKNSNEDVDIRSHSDSLLLRRQEYRGSLPGVDRDTSKVTSIR
jgi:hypothetical protein